MADPTDDLLPVAVQQGAEAYLDQYERPPDPWLDPVRWARVLAARRFVVPERAIRLPDGRQLNQLGAFLLMQVIGRDDGDRSRQASDHRRPRSRRDPGGAVR